MFFGFKDFTESPWCPTIFRPGDLLQREMKDSGPVKAEIEAARSEISVLHGQLEKLKEENEALRTKASEEDRSWEGGYRIYIYILQYLLSTYGELCGEPELVQYLWTSMSQCLWMFIPPKRMGEH